MGNQLTQEIVNITCDYITEVENVSVTTLDVKNRLRAAGFSASQADISVMVASWADGRKDIVRYTTYAKVVA